MSRFERLPVRIGIFVFWLALLVGGLACFRSFMKQLDTGVNPPPGSLSYDAKGKLQDAFGVPPVMLTALVRSRSGAPIINVTSHGPPYLHLPSNLPIPPYSPIADILHKLNLSSNISSGNTPLSPAARNISRDLLERSLTLKGTCKTSFASFWDVNTLARTFPALVEAFGLFSEHTLFNGNGSSTLMVTTITDCGGKPVDNVCVGHDDYCQPIQTLTDQFKDYASAYAAHDDLQILITSFPEISLAVLGGISSTLDASTMTLPVALLVLAIMLANARLLLCTLVNIACCIAATILVMYPVSLCTDVSSEAPSLMIAVALALSIDYSLFLLSRFSEEVSAGQTVEAAVDIMLATSGHTVLVSGTTLCLCFLGMLCIPVSTISSMGLAAAVTVTMAIGLALTLSPALLLTFPVFFTSSRTFGLTLDGCCRAASSPADAPLAHLSGSLTAEGHANEAEPPPETSSTHDPVADEALSSPFKPRAAPRGCWARVGSWSQRFSILILLAAVGIVVPFGIVLPSFDYVEGVLPMLPHDNDATVAFVALQQSFGVGTVFPNTLLLRPPKGTDVASAAWLEKACASLHRVARDVSNSLADKDIDYAMSFSDFTGLMVQHGVCTAALVDAFPPVGKLLSSRYVSNGATKVSVSLKLNPFTRDGQQWIKAVRDALAHESERPEVGTLVLSGIGPEQMDGADATFHAFPLMILVTLLIVTVVIGVAFQSVIVPIRAVICIVWMLAIVFGAAILIYQKGALEWLGIPAFQPQGGALFWMSPCIAFSIVVGLGLDYDVFFTESIVEAYDKGATAKEAVVEALAHTGNIICAAGIVMAIAFGALMFGSSALNQIAFLLCFGVLIDCFVTTKLIIPAVCSLLSTKKNFWPRKRKGGH
mmetsp:Transcript_28884/g.70314  ORF Transcript_28884/g.70314 Transcript_28884/m.70314 type:complete len:881 (+) Transcript_28884:59-2701(+)